MIRFAALAVLVIAPVAHAADWPVWRGPNGDGIVTDPAVPLEWSATKNVVWKVPVPGIGHSSPVVSNGRLFLTSFDEATNGRLLLCFDRKNGKQLWKQTVLVAPPETMHKNNTPASATPATDGKHVWVAFANGETIAVTCFDFAGKRIWHTEFDGYECRHGFCGTPVLFENTVIVNGDSDGDAFLAAVDKLTGKTQWKVARPNHIRSFSVPLFIEVDGKTQMVLAGSKSVAGFDPKSGKQLWVVDSETMKFVATVAFADGLVLATGTSPNSTITAINPTGSENVTNTHVVWSDTKGAAYVPSPLGFAKRFFVVTDTGIAMLREAKTGKVIWSERLGSRLHHASPLLINGKIVCLADDGKAYVLSSGDEFAVLAENELGEDCHATPAVSEGQLFIRSTQHLWCIGATNNNND